jgi:hypothetical protein
MERKLKIMNIELKEHFLAQWDKYLGNTELPIPYYCSDGDGGADHAEKPSGRSCII